MFSDELQERILTSLCDPDPGTSYQRDCDVMATVVQNDNELTGVGDMRLLPGGTDSSRRSGRGETWLQQNKKCGVLKRKLQMRWTERTGIVRFTGMEKASQRF